MSSNQFLILFIDEDEAELDKFQEYADGYESISVMAIPPPKTIQDIIQIVLENKIDAVISDFDLKDRKPNQADYFGDEVIENILEIKPNFPVFVFTSHENKALDHAHSVYYVFDKKLMNDADKLFLKKVEKEIIKYQERINNWKKEFASLRLKKLKKSTSAKEDERLIELDSLLEKTINQKTSIASQIKEEQKKSLEILINSTDKILNEIKNNFKKNN